MLCTPLTGAARVEHRARGPGGDGRRRVVGQRDVGARDADRGRLAAAELLARRVALDVDLDPVDVGARRAPRERAARDLLLAAARARAVLEHLVVGRGGRDPARHVPVAGPGHGELAIERRAGDLGVGGRVDLPAGVRRRRRLVAGQDGGHRPARGGAVLRQRGFRPAGEQPPAAGGGRLAGARLHGVLSGAGGRRERTERDEQESEELDLGAHGGSNTGRRREFLPRPPMRRIIPDRVGGQPWRPPDRSGHAASGSDRPLWRAGSRAISRTSPIS